MSIKKRVVITGLGAVSPLGIGVEKFWSGLLAGHSGIRAITHFDASAFDCRIAGTVPDYNPADYFDTKEARHVDKFVQFAVVAAREAVKTSQIDLKRINLDRMGVLIGSGIGGLETLETEYKKLTERGPSRVSPFFIPKMIINEAAGHVSIDTGARGLATCTVTACATATNAIGDAFRFLQYGDADVILAGGTESAVTPLGVAGFCALKALTTNNALPEKASRPFDLNRDGFIMGEGAGVLLMETLDHAQARGAKILAEIVGYGRTSDAYHITAPEPGGVTPAKAMTMAIQDAGLKTEEISYVNAHGTSTKLNDQVESLAIKLALKDHAKKVAVSSTKSMTGHLLGAAGGIEMVASVLAIRDQVVPPTINYATPDPDCDLDYVPNHSRKMTVKAVMKNSLGFGGHNATLVIKKFEK